MKPHRTKIPPRINKLLRDAELLKLTSYGAGVELRKRGVAEADISLFFIGRARKAVQA